MSVQKKSLIGNRTAVKKAIIASKPDTTSVGEPMKAQQLSLKAKRAGHLSLKATKHAANFVSFKAAKKV